MPYIRKSLNYPCIMQQDPLWCIPAAIENVMKYHKQTVNINQAQIVQLYTQQYQFNTICFNKISQVLKSSRYGQHWNFFPSTWSSENRFKTYIKNCIHNHSPVIISMRLQGQSGVHMFTVLGMNKQNYRIFDTGYLPTAIEMNIRYILRNLSPARGTLLIEPI